MSVGKPGAPLVASVPATVSLDGPVYIGIGVCSHDAQVLRLRVFECDLQELPATEAHPNPENVAAKFIYDLEARVSASPTRRTNVGSAQLFPRWQVPPGEFGWCDLPLCPGAKGEAQPEALALDKHMTATTTRRYQPDGKRLAFSAEHAPARGSQVYVCQRGWDQSSGGHR